MALYYLTTLRICSYRSLFVQSGIRLQQIARKTVSSIVEQLKDAVLEIRWIVEELVQARNMAFPSTVITGMLTASVLVSPAPALLTLPERPIEYEAAMAVPRMLVAAPADAASIQYGFPEIEELKPRVMASNRAVVTYYESKVGQTDASPFITASGTHVHLGTVASNCYPIGTKLRLPELASYFGGQEIIFTVEDRMNPRYQCGILDIWLPESPDNKKFGKRVTTVEIIDPASLKF